MRRICRNKSFVLCIDYYIFSHIIGTECRSKCGGKNTLFFLPCLQVRNMLKELFFIYVRRRSTERICYIRENQTSDQVRYAKA